ncbi:MULTISPECIES: ethanolamine utilization protein EutH [Agrobacterium]|uniref:Ethanolamine utilization protein EutH n=1 Tax=Agrobacterium tumefaciens TaxID=358 RepID=A0AAE6BB42_AGRTU|nr:MULTISPECIES: ethanolamine utilization protein EutH [Agrobacterium]QCL74038.1 ethanolamine utilization protein EutH [Agrobacterium tumefaciens]QCL79615.1 ethanolamine utilization protein EutH [Agrobacterium tumefaciens]
MENIGTYVIYFIMVCAVAGAIASLIDSESGLGKEFISGLHSIGPIFVPVAGIMASIPYLSKFISSTVGPMHAALGVDPAIAATTIIATDMGGYQLAKALASSPDGWVMATIVGFMAGATIIFSIPVGLTMLKKADHKYMALGVMAGVLSIPIGVILSSLMLVVFAVPIRPDVAATGAATEFLSLSMATIVRNVLPLAAFCGVLAVGLRFFPERMISLFLLFGRFMHIAITLVLVASIVEYFTSFFTYILGGWGFAPIIADADDQFRALEIAGYIGIMLSGAFPMVYLISKYLAGPMEVIGSKVGLSKSGATGLLAASANILAMFRLIGDMPPKGKVLVIAFSVCAAFSFGDHLAFSANFQPSLILPLLIGKFGGGLAGFGLAYWLSVPSALKLEHQQEPASGLLPATT